MAHVVVGVMTCKRFHRTRGHAQSETWLRRARRVVFFSDDANGASEELHAPVVEHAFEPSETERVFAGGNWRAVPILRALAEGFFSPAAQAAMVARGEPLPQWTFMVDDDSYAFVPKLLAELASRDPSKPHYVGYAFIASPHLEGVLPGERQPYFANGGAGIAVSRGALIAARPIFAKCEAAYRWDWPGDVRVAQCLLDAGVAVEWVRSFHAEAPDVIIHKKRPPPGSVAVGLSLPPLSFHHVSPESLHALERMHAPLYASHPSSGVRLQMHYGYEAFLLPPKPRSAEEGVAEAAAGTVAADTGAGDAGAGLAESPDDVNVVTQTAKHLTSFTAVTNMPTGASGGGPSAARGSSIDRFVQTFAGGDCSQHGKLLGGLSTVVTTHCGACSGAPWQPVPSASGLRVCNFSFAHCTLHVAVALDAPLCPRPTARVRTGLDAGSAAGWADVLRDGVATRRWAPACSAMAAGGSSDAVLASSAGGRGGAGCASLRVERGVAASLSLWLRVLSGTAVVRLTGPTVVDDEDGAEQHGRMLRVQVWPQEQRTLLLSGTVPPVMTIGAEDAASRLSAALEPPATSIALRHNCTRSSSSPTVHNVRLTLEVQDHAPVEIAWRVRCVEPGS